MLGKLAHRNLKVTEVSARLINAPVDNERFLRDRVARVCGLSRSFLTWVSVVLPAIDAALSHVSQGGGRGRPRKMAMEIARHKKTP